MKSMLLFGIATALLSAQTSLAAGPAAETSNYVCSSNYRDLFFTSVHATYKGSRLTDFKWTSATTAGHECVVTSGAFAESGSALFAFVRDIDSGDDYLIAPASSIRNDRCVVRIRRNESGLEVSAAYPGACHSYCGANVRLPPTIVLATEKCRVPRLEGQRQER